MLGSAGVDEASQRLIASLSDYAIFSPHTPMLRGAADPQQRVPIGLNGGRLAEAVRDLKALYARNEGTYPLDEYVDLLDWVETMGVDAESPKPTTLSPSVPSPALTVGFVDRFMHRRRNRVTAYDASEGALYVLFLATLALHPEAPPIFAIDNFDQALNPRLARRVTQVLTEHLTTAPHEDLPSGTWARGRPLGPEKTRHARQVLLTSHSPQVLDGLDISRDDVRLFAVDRDPQGATYVRRIQVSEKILNEARDGTTLSRLWVMGRLGGVPNV